MREGNAVPSSHRRFESRPRQGSDLRSHTARWGQNQHGDSFSLSTTPTTSSRPVLLGIHNLGSWPDILHSAHHFLSSSHFPRQDDLPLLPQRGEFTASGLSHGALLLPETQLLPLAVWQTLILTQVFSERLPRLFPSPPTKASLLSLSINTSLWGFLHIFII